MRKSTIVTLIVSVALIILSFIFVGLGPVVLSELLS